MTRKLKDIDVEEISIVDAPSNRKKFLIVKKDDKKKEKLHVAIDSDGTIQGTKILVNGEEIKNMTDFNFSFYLPRGKEVDGPTPISCSYSKVTETEDGFKHTDHFYLSKSKEVEIVKELKSLMKDLLGDEFSEEEFQKAEKKLDEKVVSALKGALKILGKYKGDFPDDLKGAVNVLARHAGYGYPAKKYDTMEEIVEVLGKIDVEKSAEKLSKSAVKQIKKAVEVLQKLLAAAEAEVKKDDTGGLEEIKEDLAEIKKALEKKDDGDADSLKKTLDKIEKRLETVEKAGGLKKSLEGDGKEGDGKKKEFSWKLGKILDGEE